MSASDRRRDRDRQKRRIQQEADELPTLSSGALSRLKNGGYAHVAEAYRDTGAPGTAASLTRNLRPWARRRVLAA